MVIEAENAELRKKNAELIKLRETIGRVCEQRDTLSAENGMLRDRVDGLEAALVKSRRETAGLPTSYPMQPVYLDKDGVARFKANAVVDWLFRSNGMDLNRIPTDALDVGDVEVFWQMLGYSVSGYGDLSFVRDETVARADAEVEILIGASGAVT